MERIHCDPAIAPLFQQHDESGGDFSQAIDLFTTNPELAMKRYGHRPEIMNALRAFSGHFGEQLSRMADVADQRNKGGVSGGPSGGASGGAAGGGVARSDKERAVLVDKSAAGTAGTDITPFFQVPDDLPEHEKELVRKVLCDTKVQVCAGTTARVGDDCGDANVDDGDDNVDDDDNDDDEKQAVLKDPEIQKLLFDMKSRPGVVPE